MTASVEDPQEVGRARTPWYRRRRVHVVLGLLVAVLAAFWAGERAAQGVRDNLDARLSDAGAGVDASLVTLEAEQLSVLRSIVFTDGVGRALATGDIRTLNRLVTPLQANADVPMVDVTLPSGRVVLAVRSKGAPLPVASRAGMPAIAQVQRRAHGRRGGRLSELAIFRSGPTLVTIGPILDGSTPVGTALAMTPLADALGRFSQQVGTTLTAFDADGVPIATTSPTNPPPLDTDLARTLIGGGPVVHRTDGGRRVALGRLILDHRPVAVLETSLPDNSWVTGRAVILYVAIGLICAMLIVASFSLRLASRWWR